MYPLAKINHININQQMRETNPSMFGKYDEYAVIKPYVQVTNTGTGGDTIVISSGKLE